MLDLYILFFELHFWIYLNLRREYRIKSVFYWNILQYPNEGYTRTLKRVCLLIIDYQLYEMYREFFRKYLQTVINP